MAQGAFAPYGHEIPSTRTIIFCSFSISPHCECFPTINCVLRYRLHAEWIAWNSGLIFFHHCFDSPEPLINRIRLNGNCEKKKPNEYWCSVFMQKGKWFLVFYFSAVHSKWFSIFFVIFGPRMCFLRKWRTTRQRVSLVYLRCANIFRFSSATPRDRQQFSPRKINTNLNNLSYGSFGWYYFSFTCDERVASSSAAPSLSFASINSITTIHTLCALREWRACERTHTKRNGAEKMTKRL